MLKSMLGFAKGDRFDPTTRVFPDINVENLTKDLGLERVGLDRGKNDIPGPEDQGFDSVEHEITSVVGTLRMKGLDYFQQHQQVYAERLGRAAESRVEIETIAGDAEVDFQAEVKIWNGIMANKRNMVSVSGGELQRFYERNRVDGAAKEGSGVYKFIGLATVMLVIESLGNGLLFREASTQGLLGGFVIAVSISVLNVGFASLTGLLARNFNHVRWLRKLSALVLVAGFAVLVAAINLAAAHFRDAATSVGEMETAAATALTQFAMSPHQLDSLQSWLLVGLGFLIAIIAGWKGYCIDDPYPGFGRVWRQMIHARDQYARSLEQAIDELVEARDDAVGRLREESEAARGRIEEAVDALAGQSSLRGRLDLFLEQCDQKANHLLAIYRDANRSSRKAGSPAHFSESYSFKPFVSEGPDAGIVDAARTEQEEIKGIVSSVIERIYAAAKDAISSYPETHELEEQNLSGTVLKAVKANPVAVDDQVLEITKRRKMAS